MATEGETERYLLSAINCFKSAIQTCRAGSMAFGPVPTVRQRASVLTLESNSEAASRDGDRIDTRAPKVVFTFAFVMKPPVAGGFARF
jgi:hypothetical protein